MPEIQKVCRVCGKAYRACRSTKTGDGVFHWQEVACSPECGTEYFRMVQEARGHTEKQHKGARHTKKKETQPVNHIYHDNPESILSGVDTDASIESIQSDVCT